MPLEKINKMMDKTIQDTLVDVMPEFMFSGKEKKEDEEIRSTTPSEFFEGMKDSVKKVNPMIDLDTSFNLISIYLSNSLRLIDSMKNTIVDRAINEGIKSEKNPDSLEEFNEKFDSYKVAIEIADSVLSLDLKEMDIEHSLMSLSKVYLDDPDKLEHEVKEIICLAKQVRILSKLPEAITMTMNYKQYLKY